MSKKVVKNVVVAKKPDPIDEEESSGTEEIEDLFEIFQVMHKTINNLELLFKAFLNNPTEDEYKTFEKDVNEFLTITRDLKKIGKSLIKRVPQPKQKSDAIPIEPKKRGRKKKSVNKEDVNQEQKN